MTSEQYRTYRAGLPDRPARIRALPLSDKGYPVPWFVEWIDGVPDFRVMDSRKRFLAVKRSLCWICGQPLGSFMTFVAGPMCGINRTSGEPPAHHDCAVYAAQACPFLTLPRAQYREANMPEHNQMTPGAIKRNPGVAMLWTTRSYKPFAVDERASDWLIEMGEPTSVEWLAEGRTATRAEVDESIRTGMPFLENACENDDDRRALATFVERLRPHLPQEQAISLFPGDKA